MGSILSFSRSLQTVLVVYYPSHITALRWLVHRWWNISIQRNTATLKKQTVYTCFIGTRP